MKISVRQIKENRKDYTEFYSKSFSKHFSPYITLISIRLGITANAITYIMWFTGILAAFLLLSENILLRTIAGILLITINILDTSDGEVARLTDTSSSFGVALDKIAHFTTNIALFYCIGLSLAQFYESSIPSHLSTALILFCCADEMIKELYLSQTLKQQNENASKMDISYDRNSKADFIVHLTAGGTGFYHILPIMMAIDWSFDLGRLLQLTYLAYFLLVNILKFIIRFLSVKTKLS